MKNKYYMLVTKLGKPMVISSKLPIYWLKKVANAQAKLLKCDVIQVEVSRFIKR